MILTAMKAVATEQDGSRPVSIAPTGAIGTGGLARVRRDGLQLHGPAGGGISQGTSREAGDGHGDGERRGHARRFTSPIAKKGYVGSYDPYTTTGRASAEGWWSFCNSRPWLSGGFVWTGFDYRGEPSPNGWPNISSQYGIIDTCGFPKDSFFYYQSWWTVKAGSAPFPALELAGNGGQRDRGLGLFEPR